MFMNGGMFRKSDMTMSKEIDEAILSHIKWGLRLKAAINSEMINVSTDHIARDDLCPFGKWLYSDAIPVAAKSLNEYQEVINTHRRFHNCAATIVSLALSGNFEEAYMHMADNSDYTIASVMLILNLRLWQANTGNISHLL